MQQFNQDLLKRYASMCRSGPYGEVAKMAQFILDLGPSHGAVEYVNPSAAAQAAGWDRPDTYEWPGTVIHRFTTASGKNVIQFLIKSKHDRGYELRTWDESALEIVPNVV